MLKADSRTMIRLVEAGRPDSNDAGDIAKLYGNNMYTLLVLYDWRLLVASHVQHEHDTHILNAPYTLH